MVWNCRILKVWVFCFCFLVLAFLLLPADRKDRLRGYLALIVLPFIADALHNTNYYTAPLGCCTGLHCLCQQACRAQDSKFGPTRINSVHAAPSFPSCPPTELPRWRFSLFSIPHLAFAASADISLKGEFIQNRYCRWSVITVLIKAVVTFSIPCNRWEVAKIWNNSTQWVCNMAWT